MRGINIISMLIGFWGFNIFPILAQTQVKPESIDNLICFWSFMEESGTERISSGRCQYALREGTPFIERVKEGVFGEYSARIKEGEWFYIPRAQCPALNIHGKDGEVTVVAWIKRDVKQYSQCEAVAGMWDETRKKRQYCLFLDLRAVVSKQEDMCPEREVLPKDINIVWTLRLVKVRFRIPNGNVSDLLMIRKKSAFM